VAESQQAVKQSLTASPEKPTITSLAELKAYYAARLETAERDRLRAQLREADRRSGPRFDDRCTFGAREEEAS
jgi:hypothetical protein